MKLIFTCAICGKGQLEEVMGDATVTSEIVTFAVDDDGGEPTIEYGLVKVGSGRVARIQCAACGEYVAEDCGDITDDHPMFDKPLVIKPHTPQEGWGYGCDDCGDGISWYPVGHTSQDAARRECRRELAPYDNLYIQHWTMIDSEPVKDGEPIAV